MMQRLLFKQSYVENSTVWMCASYWQHTDQVSIAREACEVARWPVAVKDLEAAQLRTVPPELPEAGRLGALCRGAHVHRPQRLCCVQLQTAHIFQACQGACA